ncbi:homoserine dehydrogenase [Thermococcus sp. MV5]|uniref:homoserine dehydrogenase n=1 Tax=Thermococcus sp. MV5 TaxID=1638272 RepID=UPI001439D31C|nr:homoserine dehydrogenase [Thermococcus sp. MV5]NJE26746.1 homoserine dehydrogenase [Thermococcus sp. MV5]
MNSISLSIIGFGNVGKGVAEVLYTKNRYFKEKYGAEIKVVSISDSSATLWNSEGINLKEALEVKKSFGSLKFWGQEYEIYSLNPNEVVEEIESDIVVDVTNDPNAGKWHLKALKAGKIVVTSNKPPVVFYYNDLISESHKKRIPYLFEATVMAGTPIITLLRTGMPADSVIKILGVLNGTTTFILNSIENGMDFQKALKRAQELGIAERDPSGDLKGIDAAYKAVILHNLAFRPIDFDKVQIEGIEFLSEDEVRKAKKNGEPFRLLASIEDGKIEVNPTRIPIDSPLAVNGTSNIAIIETDLLGELIIKGPGAGIKETASGVVGDIIRAIRIQNDLTF